MRVELRDLILDHSTVQEFLLKMHTILDALDSIGDIIPATYHIYVILEGLPSEFVSVVSVIERKFGLMNLDEVEILLIAHELRINKFKKSYTPYLMSFNLAQAQAGSSVSEDTKTSSIYSTSAKISPSSTEQDFGQFRGSRGSRGGHFGRGIGRNYNAHIQCNMETLNSFVGTSLIRIINLLLSLVTFITHYNGLPDLMATIIFLRISR